MIWQLNTDYIRDFRFAILIKVILVAKLVIEKQNKPKFLVLLVFSCFVL